MCPNIDIHEKMRDHGGGGGCRPGRVDNAEVGAEMDGSADASSPPGIVRMTGEVCAAILGLEIDECAAAVNS